MLTHIVNYKALLSIFLGEKVSGVFLFLLNFDSSTYLFTTFMNTTFLSCKLVVSYPSAYGKLELYFA